MDWNSLGSWNTSTPGIISHAAPGGLYEAKLVRTPWKGICPRWMSLSALSISIRVSRLVDQFVTAFPRSVASPGELTDRELEVLTLIGRGQGTHEIAEKLFLSVKTVEAHRERIKEKLKLKNSSELLRYATQFTLDGTVSELPRQ